MFSNITKESLDTLVEIIYSAEGFLTAWLVASSPHPQSDNFKTIKILDDTTSESISIIDLYSGKMPFMIDYPFLLKQTAYQVLFAPTLLLDSNIASAYGLQMLSIYRETREINKPIIKKLMRHVLEKNLHVSPLFYCFETLIKKHNLSSYSYLLDTLHGILISQSINTQIFLNKGKIIFSEATLEHYYQRYGSYYLRVVAEKQLEKNIAYSNDSKKDIQKLVSTIYLILLKMVLIDKKSKRLLLSKLKDLYAFMLKDLSLICSYELCLGTYYFAGLAGKFLNVELTTSFEKAIRLIENSSWDIFFMRMPAEALKKDSTGVVNILFPCTAEKKLQEIATLLNIDFLIQSDDIPSLNNGGISFQFNDMLSKRVSHEQEEEINEWLLKVCKERYYERMKNPKPLVEPDLERIKSGLELELRQMLCSI